MDRAEAFRERLEEHWRKVASGDVFHEIRQQTEVLETAIAEEISAFRILSHELKILRGALQAFIVEYCGAIGEQVAALEYTEKQLAEHGGKEKEYKAENSLDSLHFSYAPIESSDLSSEDVKRLYRRLAKAIHPDTAPENPKAAEMFALLNASYLNQDMAGLVKLQREVLNRKQELCGEENPVQMLERLEREYDEVKKAADAVKRQKHELTQSPAYKLQQYAVWYRMCGDNLIARTREKLEREIQSKRRMLDCHPALVAEL